MRKRSYAVIGALVLASGVIAFAVPAMASNSDGGYPSPSDTPTVVATQPAYPTATPTPTVTVTAPVTDPDVNCVQALDEEFIFANGHREVTRTETVLECQVPTRYGGWQTVILPEIGQGR